MNTIARSYEIQRAAETLGAAIGTDPSDEQRYAIINKVREATGCTRNAAYTAVTRLVTANRKRARIINA